MNNIKNAYIGSFTLLHNIKTTHVKSRWLGYFELPNILQSENGLEFKNQKIVTLVTKWEGDCELRYGRPRHPQTQGLVKQANGTAEKMLAAAIEQNKKKVKISKLIT